MSTDRVGESARLDPPQPVLEIARTLEHAGFETWCVGGAVRDALLGHTHLDWDLATRATPAEVQKLFRRTVPVGIEFGTVGVLDRDGVMHEVTTFRRDVETDGRHAVVAFGASLDEDLARRDFTINAIAYSPTMHVLRDPFGGRADLAARIVRAVGTPEARMREDRLRALRAIRFAARFGFTIERETWAAIVASAPYLGRLSMERVQQELQKTMEQVERPGAALRLWRESGALASLIPALASISDLALATLDRLPRARTDAESSRTMNRLAALFLDLDPSTVPRVLRGLRFSNHAVAWIAAAVERWHHLQPELRRVLAGDARPGDAELRRWVAVMGRTRVGAVLRVAAARFAAERDAGRPAPSASSIASLYRRTWRAAFRDPVEVGDLAVDGNDVVALGIPAGPTVGRVLRSLLDDVLEDPARNTREWLERRALELARRSGR